MMRIVCLSAPAGRYQIGVARQGFRSAQLELDAADGQRLTVNLSLEVGSIG